MKTLGYVELLNRSGDVKERHRILALPCRLGRGYDADILVDDPYVAPAHLEITRFDANGAWLRDNNTVNGVILVTRRQGKRLTSDTWVSSDELIRIGHTQLRIRQAATPVAPERQLTHSEFFRWIHHPLAALLLVILMFGWKWLQFYNLQTNSNFQDELIKLWMAGVFALLGWGIFTGIPRGSAGTTNLAAHIALFCLTLIGLGLLQEGVYILWFALDWPGQHWAQTAVLTLALGWLGYHSSGLIWRVRGPVRLIWVSSLLAIVLLFDEALPLLLNKEDNTIQLETTFRPGFFLLVPGENPRIFLDQATTIRNKLQLSGKP